MADTPSPVEFGAPSKFTEWRDGQDVLFWNILDSPKRFTIHNAPVGCHAAGTPILMYSGRMRPVESIQPGDFIMGPGGSPRRVLQLHCGISHLYTITPHRGGPPFTVNADHILHLVKTTEGIDRRAGRNFARKKSGPDRIDISVRDYLLRSENFKKHYKLVRSAVEFPLKSGKTFPNPYFLGVYLGDGTTSGRGIMGISSADPEIVEEVYRVANTFGMCVREKPKKDNKATDYYIHNTRRGNRYNRNAIREWLRELGICGLKSGDKFIPEELKTARRFDRLQLLAGLMDTDGFLASNCFEYTSKSLRLVCDTVFVARSLGFMCNDPVRRVIDGQVYWRVSISGDTDQIPTRIPRKQATKRRQKKNHLRTGFKITEAGIGQYFGFEVDVDNLYLTGDFTVHHNSGKSPAYMTAAIAAGKRVAIITESKGLQDQLAEDFGCIGLFDMRGLQNYTCSALQKGGEYEDLWMKRWGKPTCDVGPCTAGLRCDLKDSGCEYFDDYRRAQAAQMVSTNFAYWIAIHRYGQGLGKFDWLIIDECHSADSQLSSAMSVEFTAKEFKELDVKPLKATDTLQSWRMWGRVQLDRVTGKLDFFKQGAKIGQTVGAEGVLTLVQDTDLPDASEMKFWKKLEGKCKILSESTDDWVIEQDENNGNIRMAPVWVRQYAETHLFMGIRKIIMTSATVREKIVGLLGIHEDYYDFVEYPSVFPVERRPIYWIPTVRLGYGTNQSDLRSWVVRIDQIIARRGDRKGIIHTVSYQRQQYLLAHSRFRDIMHANTPGNTRDVVKSFRAAKAPAVLVSPSVGTGFDFPHDAARYQIIGKVPFRDARGAIIKAQSAEDPDYLNYLTAQDLIQMYGRPNRAPTDYSETFIVDDHIEWFLQRYSDRYYDKSRGRFIMSKTKQNAGTVDTKLFPYYFLEAFQRVDSVMDPLPLEAI